MAENQKRDKNEDVKSPAQEREERVLKYWQDKDIFRKSVDRAPAKGDFVFYDGPPFATGQPHFGHVLPTSIKDAIPRYKTMQGYRVRRRWGWDCHGLPVENIVERELGLPTKKDILDFGIGKFNDAARAAVRRYVADWKNIIPRLGRWADMDDDYETMNASYTESVWWAFKTLHDKGLVYEGFKPMQICPHCETTLSNFEVAQGYKDIKDISVYAKFELADEPNTFLVAWTTTPWTLPGNAALAVNPETEYIKMAIGDGSKLIFASSRIQKIPGFEKVIGVSLGEDKENIKKVIFRGSDLVGKSYKPVFDYYSKDASLKNRSNGWKVYAADFVTTTDGTGIVHIAPAFGTDDYTLGQKENLPFIQHVNIDGTFKPEVTDFAGLKVKPKDTAEDPQAHLSADVKILKFLQEKGSVFAKENITHSYPHCWRCETPLLNYAASSWFVRVSDFKEKLVAENKKVSWVPPEVGEGRFGNWLENARDWAISRSRFWGAPIPVWRVERQSPAASHSKPLSRVSEEGGEKALRREKAAEEMIVIGSVADLKKYSKAKNTYYVMRHGEAENNSENVISSRIDDPKHLTDAGREQVKKAAVFFGGKKIDMIFASPFVRTRETAEALATAIGFEKKGIVTDVRLSELDAGVYHGRPFDEFVSYFPQEKRFSMRPEGGENYVDVRKRVGAFIYAMEREHSGKSILIVTHDAPAFILESVAFGLDDASTISARGGTLHYFKNAEVRALDFAPLPHNENYELDLHRPYIDEIKLRLPDGEHLVRVEEVFDCWFESGSMPYAEAHYPFETKDFDPARGGWWAKLLRSLSGGILGKSRGYPADFIAEGVDQTRGWFYSMLVLGTALFGRVPYKNVVVNGIVLAEDGQKMSKSKNNFPDLLPVVNKYGADALRYYLLSSPLVRAQEFCFSEKGVDEVVKKHIGRLLNVVSFYELYAGGSKRGDGTFESEGIAEADEAEHEGGAPKRRPVPRIESSGASRNILDQWITSRLDELNGEVTDGLEKYELDKATRPFADFIDDLSTWYLRRSRDRFKGDDEADKSAALATTRFVLLELSKLLAPFMPFVAEEIYLKLRGGMESVHLDSWPVAGNVGSALLEDMKTTRTIASLGLEARSKAKVNVRQPLRSLKVKSESADRRTKIEDSALIELIKEEVNVKEILFDEKTASEAELDTNITSELKEEGALRELVRAVQDARKEAGLSISDQAILKISAEGSVREFVEKNKAGLMKSTGLRSVSYVPAASGEKIAVGDHSLSLEVSA